MATSAVDRNVKIWDVRNLGEALQSYKLRSSASHLDFSQNKLLSVAMGNVVEVYRWYIERLYFWWPLLVCFKTKYFYYSSGP